MYNSKIITNINPLEEAVLMLLEEKVLNEKALFRIKNKIAEKYKIPCPKNTLLLQSYHNLTENKKIKPSPILEELLKTSKIRSLSGIVVVSILTKPYPCPGKCLYCPSQKGIPKSYLDNEPAVMRAVQNNFDPYKQVQFRLRGLKDTGHPIDKINIRVIGGTWSYYPKKYQSWFIAKCFQACNEFNSDFPLFSQAVQKLSFRKREALCGIQNQLTLLDSRFRGNDKKEILEQSRNKMEVYPATKYQTLENSQKTNERAKCRIVEISIETRPDYINIQEIKHLRNLGVTKVELGIQSLYDDVLKLNKRGHNISAAVKATKLLKDAGFKVSYQMMLNLPGSNFKRDLRMFKELFQNPDFKPDHLKIYPLAIVKEAPVYKLFKQKKIKPYSKKTLINLLKSIKKEIPYWCRVERVIRDIPSPNVIAGGVKISNLRQDVLKEMEKEGLKCKCIRCREIKEKYIPKEKIFLFRQDYDASGGKEIFLSFENKNRTKLYSLLRLRIPSATICHCEEVVFNDRRSNPSVIPAPHSVIPNPPYVIPAKAGIQNNNEKTHSHCPFPILKNAAIIREIHTYGQMLPLLEKKPPSFAKATDGQAPQHKGLGKKLAKEAENIVARFARELSQTHADLTQNNAEFRRYKIAVISGVGARNYWRKLRYKLKDGYMIKKCGV